MAVKLNSGINVNDKKLFIFNIFYITTEYTIED